MGFPNADMQSAENTSPKPPAINYWRLWILNAVLVSTGVLLFLAAQYGTYDFFWRACLMALLPFIPIMVLVGGAGSTIFALTKVLIEKRKLNKSTTLALLLGPGLVMTLLLILPGVSRSSGHWLNYVCAGNAPASVANVKVTGYSGFLREEWLAAFNIGQTNFQTMIERGQFVPADGFEFQRRLERSALKQTQLSKRLPPLRDALCYKRVFDRDQEHQRGSIFALFDPATSTAVVFRYYQD